MPSDPLPNERLAAGLQRPRNLYSYGVTALIAASQQGHQEIVRALLDAKADVNAKAGNGATALMLAARAGNQEIVRALLDARADVNAKDNVGATALILASLKGHQEVVQLLKGAGAVGISF
jgi:ankyrin repeat protein